MPARPGWLAPAAKREWSRLAPDLVRLGLLTPIDRIEFSMICQCWALYEEANKDIQENGTTFTTETGYQGPRPSVALMVKMMDKIIQLGAKFGLSPSDRARIDLPMPEEEDEFTAFLKKQRGDD